MYYLSSTLLLSSWHPLGRGPPFTLGCRAEIRAQACLYSEPTRHCLSHTAPCEPRLPFFTPLFYYHPFTPLFLPSSRSLFSSSHLLLIFCPSAPLPFSSSSSPPSLFSSSLSSSSSALQLLSPFPLLLLLLPSSPPLLVTSSYPSYHLLFSLHLLIFSSMLFPSSLLQPFPFILFSPFICS
jgi:hypothetical protein